VDWGSAIEIVPQGFYRANATGFDIFEGAVEAGEDFGFGGVVAIGYGELLKGLEDEGFEGEVLLGGELGELVFEIGGKLDG
jgi:hypothetical protein